MDFLPIFMKMVELFIVIIIGYAATVAGVINRQIKSALSKIILYISMPCTIIASVATTETFPSGEQLARLLIVAFTSYGVMFILGKITGIILGLKGPQRGAAEFGIMFSNVGFIGFPVTEAIFGTSALLYTSIFNLPFNLLCYSLGVSMLRADIEDENDGAKVSPLKRFAALFISPALISSIIALIIALFKMDVPDIITNTTVRVGGITTPGALLIIGAALAEMPVKDMFTNVKTYLFTVFSVIVTPLLIYLIYRPFTAADPLLLGVAVIVFAMPVATAGTMLCVQYGGDEKFMAQTTFLTTLVSVVTIPLLAVFLSI